MAQRNLSERDVEYVLRYGYRVFNGGVEFRFLRKRDIRPQDRGEYARLEGTAIVIGRCVRQMPKDVLSTEYVGSTGRTGDVITVWRNRKHGLRHIRHKTKEHFWKD